MAAHLSKLSTWIRRISDKTDDNAHDIARLEKRVTALENTNGEEVVTPPGHIPGLTDTAFGRGPFWSRRGESIVGKRDGTIVYRGYRRFNRVVDKDLVWLWKLSPAASASAPWRRFDPLKKTFFGPYANSGGVGYRPDGTKTSLEEVKQQMQRGGHGIVMEPANLDLHLRIETQRRADFDLKMRTAAETEELKKTAARKIKWIGGDWAAREMHSPQLIEAVLHFFYASHVGWPDARTPAGMNVMRVLRRDGIVEPRDPGETDHPLRTYKLTPKGEAYVKALRKVPFPVPSENWEMPS